MESLALTYRPRTFNDLVGQPAVQVILRQMIKTGRIPHALLFDGCRGTGKTTTARIFAAALNCEADERPCGHCVSCKETFDGASLNVLEIDAASNGLVDDIRTLRQQVQYRQTGNYRVIILDEAQSISAAGFNALLKTIEEPPPNTVFILLTTEPQKILATVASRCMPFTFKRLTTNDITRRLAHIAEAEHHTVEPDLLQLLAERADGALRDAIMLLDQVTRVGMSTAEQYQRLIGYTDHGPTLLTHLVNADIPAAFTALDTALTRVANPSTIADQAISCLRDVLVLRSGGDINKTGVALAQRQTLALALETPTVVAALKVFWQLKTQLHTDNPRSSLELTVVMLSEILGPAARTKPAGRLGLDDMKKLA